MPFRPIRPQGRTLSRADCERLDSEDSLAKYRALFDLPANLIYLDGNSLGAKPKATSTRVAHLLEREWGDGLVRSWNEAGWADAPRRVGDMIARFLGALEGEVIVADNTSVNLYKALMAALRYQGRRGVVLTDAGNFPTDLYMAEAVARQFGTGGVRRVPREALLDSLADDVSVLTVTQVDYKTAHMFDLADITAVARARGILVVWDLCHSAGAVPIDLSSSEVDLAVGCTYKFLNGGPGAPAFLYASHRILSHLSNPLPGWFGHERPFEFRQDYVPAHGVERFQSGTPGILGLTALETALGIWLSVDMNEIRRKSVALTELLIEIVETRFASLGIRLGSPRDPAVRGSHVALTHPQGYEISRALAERGVVIDSRPPDLMRFGITPLYTRWVDIYDAAEQLAGILESESYQHPKFRIRLGVP
jgi:kynureninase